MTKSIADVLAGTNDPEVIRTILDEMEATSFGKPENDDVDTLSAQYDRFLSRRSNRSPTTIAQYKRTIPVLIDFAEANEVIIPTELNTELIDDYVDELNSRYDSDATILTYTKNARLWLKWLHEREYFEKSVYLVLNKDSLGLSPRARDEAIPADEAKHIIQQLRDKRKGSPQHAVMELAWNGGPRIGDIHSNDIDDLLPDLNALKFRHRPELGTRLKNGSKEDDFRGDGERDINLKGCVVEALQDYIELERPEMLDEFGRSALFNTNYGRASRSTIRRWIYEATSCKWAASQSDGPTCDGDCDPDTNVCPYSYYPHAIRRGAIVHHLSNGLRPDRAAERFNVGVKTIRDHYDPRENERRRQDRANAVSRCWSDW